MKRKGKNYFDLVKQLLEQEITKKMAVVLCIYFSIISILEVIAYKSGGAASIVASWLWLFTGLFLLIAFGYQTVIKLIEDVKEKCYFLLLGSAVALLFYMVLIFATSYGDLNPDATQQVAAGLSSFEMADLNYTGIAFLGYANRQYVLAAIPALLFGRSIQTLHLGFGYLFLIALFELFFEIRNWLKEKEQNEELALVPLYAMFGFRFIIEYFMNFEQAITPVALTMLCIALFLKVVRKMDVLGVVAVAWVGCFCADSYTPVLASLGLLLVFLGFYAVEIVWKNKLQQGADKSLLWDIPKVRVLLAIVLNILCFLAATLINGRSDRVTQLREDVELVPFIKECIVEFFTDTNAVFLGFFSGIVLLYMVFALIGKLKFCDFIIACWVLATIVFANYMVGYTSYSKAWILQRAMIVIPVLITGIFLAGIRIGKKKAIAFSKTGLTTVLAIFLCLGIWYSALPHQSFVYFSYIKPMKFMFQYTDELCEEYKLDETEEFNLVLYTANGFQTNIHDYCKFLYPNAHTYVPAAGTYPENADWTLPTIIFGENADFYVMYSGVEQEMLFEDSRYDCEHIWYVEVLN